MLCCHGSYDRRERVPILTQSEDWALCTGLNNQPRGILFQSSPSPKTGRYDISMIPSGLFMQSVPILTQSEDWALF